MSEPKSVFDDAGHITLFAVFAEDETVLPYAIRRSADDAVEAFREVYSHLPDSDFVDGKLPGGVCVGSFDWSDNILSTPMLLQWPVTWVRGWKVGR